MTNDNIILYALALVAALFFIDALGSWLGWAW